MKDQARFGLDKCNNCVFVLVRVAGPVADVVQTWSCACDCCLHIYLHDFGSLCVYMCALCELVSVYDDWDRDSPKSTSEGCITKTICPTDGNMSPCLTFSLFLIRYADWRVLPVFV